MKTPEELIKQQEEIEEDIYKYASVKGLSTSELQPITDGVSCPERYIKAKHQIMCILKEPYDYIKNKKMPSGGGWSIVNDCFKGYGTKGIDPKNDVWKQQTWQPLIYFLYGLSNDLHWENMHWIRDDKDMTKALQEIAYINVSKMPALSQSYYSAMVNNFRIWKPILYKQIEVYNPSVIVYHGSYEFFDNDVFSVLGGNPQHLEELKTNTYNYGNAYYCGNKLIIDVNHPICRKAGFKRGDYVNLLIDTIEKYDKKC